MVLSKLKPLRIYYLIIIAFVLNSNRKNNMKEFALSNELMELYSKYSFEFLYFINDIVLISTGGGNTEGNHERTTYSKLIQLLIQYVSNNAYVNIKLDDNNDIDRTNLNNIRARIFDDEIINIIQHISNIFDVKYDSMALSLDAYIDFMNAIVSSCSMILNTQNVETVQTSGVCGPYACSTTSEIGLFLRECILQWESMSFEEVYRSYEECLEYRSHVDVEGNGSIAVFKPEMQELTCTNTAPHTTKKSFVTPGIDIEMEEEVVHSYFDKAILPSSVCSCAEEAQLQNLTGVARIGKTRNNVSYSANLSSVFEPSITYEDRKDLEETQHLQDDIVLDNLVEILVKNVHKKPAVYSTMISEYIIRKNSKMNARCALLALAITNIQKTTQYHSNPMPNHVLALMTLNEILKSSTNARAQRAANASIVTQILLLLHIIVTSQQKSLEQTGQDSLVYFQRMVQFIDPIDILVRCIHKCDNLKLHALSHQAALLYVQYTCISNQKHWQLHVMRNKRLLYKNPLYRANVLGNEGSTRSTGSNAAAAPEDVWNIDPHSNHNPLRNIREQLQKKYMGSDCMFYKAASGYNSNVHKCSNLHTAPEENSGSEVKSFAFPYTDHWLILSALYFDNTTVLNDVFNTRHRNMLRNCNEPRDRTAHSRQSILSDEYLDNIIQSNTKTNMSAPSNGQQQVEPDGGVHTMAIGEKYHILASELETHKRCLHVHITACQLWIRSGQLELVVIECNRAFRQVLGYLYRNKSQYLEGSRLQESGGLEDLGPGAEMHTPAPLEEIEFQKMVKCEEWLKPFQDELATLYGYCIDAIASLGCFGLASGRFGDDCGTILKFSVWLSTTHSDVGGVNTITDAQTLRYFNTACHMMNLLIEYYSSSNCHHFSDSSALQSTNRSLLPLCPQLSMDSIKVNSVNTQVIAQYNITYSLLRLRACMTTVMACGGKGDTFTYTQRHAYRAQLKEIRQLIYHILNLIEHSAYICNYQHVDPGMGIGCEGDKGVDSAESLLNVLYTIVLQLN